MSLENPVVIRKNPDIRIVRTSEEKDEQKSECKTDKDGPDRSCFFIFYLLKECGNKEDIAHIKIEPDSGDLGHKGTEDI